MIDLSSEIPNVLHELPLEGVDSAAMSDDMIYALVAHKIISISRSDPQAPHIVDVHTMDNDPRRIVSDGSTVIMQIDPSAQ